MIPEDRDGSFPIPKLLIDKKDIDRFMMEFKGFHAQFADCFSRKGTGGKLLSSYGGANEPTGEELE